jgi:hypothetical protein
MTQKPDDVLQAAARALRDETLRESSAARFTRLRVMASLRESEVRRRTQTVLLLPFAACLAVASAWGMAVGGITEMRTAVVDALGLQAPPSKPPAPSEKSKSNKGKKSNRVAVPADPAPAETAPLVPAPPLTPAPALTPAPTPVLTPSPSAPSAPSTPSTALSPRRAEKRTFSSSPRALSNAPPPSVATGKAAAAPPPLSAPDQAHELYRAAHRAHFTDHDCDRALTGWDAYLAASPRGPLALEARYNRALCLVRLGRAAEARRALRPFATVPGGYRQKEASSLLAVIAEN